MGIIIDKELNCDMGPAMVSMYSIDGWDADRCEGCKLCDYCYELELKRYA